MAVRRNLTEAFVRRVRPDATKRTRYYDAHVGGLILQVEPTGKRTYTLYFRKHGRARWFKLGDADRVCLKDARRRAQVINGRLADEEQQYDPQRERTRARQSGTVGELATEWLQDRKARNRSYRMNETKVRVHILPALGKVPVADITPQDVQRLHSAITRRGNGPMANMVVHEISAMWKWGTNKGLISVPSPVVAFEYNKKRDRDRVLTDTEIPIFWHGVVPYGLAKCHCLRMILLTGQRPGDVINMRWADTDVGHHKITRNRKPYTAWGGWWSLRVAKTERMHRVWLPQACLDILAEMEGEDDEFVFGQPNLDYPMRTLSKKQGWTGDKKLTPHDLRRTHGTLVTSLGFDGDTMDRVLGHVDGRVRKVYDRYLYQHEAKEVAEVVADHITSLLGENVLPLTASSTADRLVA